MEVLFHELASGKDSVLSQVLSTLGKVCEQKYTKLRSILQPTSRQSLQSMYRRRKSVDSERPFHSDLQGQFEEVLKLRALLTVEVEALQEIRTELEDSQSMSEVHLQLERATMENRRFQSALKVAHEQISELYFNKRVLEAELEALRTDRDRQVSEAKERVRIAQKAVVAMTSNRQLNQKGDSDNKADQAKPVGTENAWKKPELSSRRPVSRDSPEGSRFKQYATLTAMNFDDFDSLDEDDHTPDDDSDREMIRTSPQPADPSNINDAKPEEKSPAPNHLEQVPVDRHPDSPSDQFPDSSDASSDEPVHEAPLEIPTPTSSSTPRKSAEEHEVDPHPTVLTPLIKDLSTDWSTPITRLDPNSVPKEDYLKLLDEMEALRQEVEALRVVREPGADVGEDRVESSNPDPGLTVQLRDLAQRVQQMSSSESTPDNPKEILQPMGPGTTHILDWSVSPNQTAPSVPSQNETTEEEADEVEAQTPVAQVGHTTTQCSRCLELQAELITAESLSYAKLTELSRRMNERIAELEATVQRLQSELNEQLLLPDTAELAIQTKPTDYCVVQLDGECSSYESTHVQTEEPVRIGTHNMPVSLAGTQTDSSLLEPKEDLAIVVEKYSKLATDAACICLALTQRLAALKRQGSLDEELAAEPSASFNLLLTEICEGPVVDGALTQDAYGAGYKMLAPALTQLNQEVELLATVLEAESADCDSKRELLKVVSDTAKIVETERRQLQAELDRRMVLFEQNHTSSLLELESSRRALIDQLAASEDANVQLKDQITVLEQKLHSKERFLAEQTEERELEREEYRHDLGLLKEQLRAAKCELLSSKLISGLPTSEQHRSTNSMDHHWLTDAEPGDYFNPSPFTTGSVAARRHTFVGFWDAMPPKSEHRNWSHLCDSTGQLATVTDVARLVDVATSITPPPGSMSTSMGSEDLALDALPDGGVGSGTSLDGLNLTAVPLVSTAVQTDDQLISWFIRPDRVDAFTDTADLSASDFPDVVTTVTTRTVNAQTAAALFQHLTLTEQSTVVVTVNRPTQATATRPRSPATLSRHTETTNEDTGIELSRGLLMASLENCALNESECPPRASSIEVPDELGAVSSSPDYAPDTPGTSAMALTTTGRTNSDESFITPGGDPESLTESRLLVSTTTRGSQTNQTMVDASCDTEELDMVPATELTNLMEQQVSSEMLITTLRTEIDELRKYQEDLQADYGLLQDMLDSREGELERYTTEILEAQARCVTLEKEIASRKNVVLERDEDMFLLREENDELKQKLKQFEENMTPLTECVDASIQTTVAGDKLEQESPLQLIEEPRLIMDDLQSAPGCTSTPDDQSNAESTDLMSASSVPEELKSLMMRLRAESARLFSLSAVGPADDTLQPEPITDVYGDSSAHVPPPSSTVLEDLVRANSSLKSALSQLSEVLDRYESPLTATSATPVSQKDQVHELIRCVAKALSTDELVWLNMLHASISQTASQLASSSDLAHSAQQTAHPNTTWNPICRVVDQLTCFIKQEHKYRECLVQAHLAERQCLELELKSTIGRSENLSEELNRYTDRLASHQQALNRADNLNLRLTNQVNNLKADVSRATSDLEVERLESAQKQSKIDQLSTQLTDEQRKSEVLQKQSNQLKADIVCLQQELARATDTITQTQDSLRRTTQRAEAAELEVDALKSRANEFSNHVAHKSISTTPSDVRPVHAHDFKPRDWTPTETPSPDNDLHSVISDLSATLSTARRSADQAERRACELQAVNHSLRLSLAETELRLMPLMTSVSPSWKQDSTPCRPSSVRSRRKQLESPQFRSEKLEELKGVCTRLLSMSARAEDAMDENADSDNDDDDTVPMPLSPTTNDQRHFGRRSSQSWRENADRNLRILQNDAISRTRLRGQNTITSSVPDTPSPLPPRTSQLSNPPRPSEIESSVSIERFQRLHTRCLRAESHKRALSFQKRYLVLLLGGFRCTPESVIAHLGRPEPVLNFDQSSFSTNDSSDGFPRCFCPSALRRFRAVARVAVVVSRMRRLVLRWQLVDVFDNAPAVGGSMSRQSFGCCSAVTSTTTTLSGQLTSPPRELGRVPLRELPAQTPVNRQSFSINDFIATASTVGRCSTLQAHKSGRSSSERVSSGGTNRHVRSQLGRSDELHESLTDSPTPLNSPGTRISLNRTPSFGVSRRPNQDVVSRSFRSPTTPEPPRHLQSANGNSPNKTSPQTDSRKPYRCRFTISQNPNTRRIPFR